MPLLQTWRMGSGAVAKRARQEMLEQPHNHFHPKMPTSASPPRGLVCPNVCTNLENVVSWQRSHSPRSEAFAIRKEIPKHA